MIRRKHILTRDRVFTDGSGTLHDPFTKRRVTETMEIVVESPLPIDPGYGSDATPWRFTKVIGQGRNQLNVTVGPEVPINNAARVRRPPPHCAGVPPMFTDIIPFSSNDVKRLFTIDPPPFTFVRPPTWSLLAPPPERPGDPVTNFALTPSADGMSCEVSGIDGATGDAVLTIDGESERGLEYYTAVVRYTGIEPPPPGRQPDTMTVTVGEELPNI